MRLGIIAEDHSDVSVIAELTAALLKPYRVGFDRFVGDGCGKVRRKCSAWTSNLVRRGCSAVIVVHDLDKHSEDELRRLLSQAVASAKPKASVILIPIQEIEAWLLFDPAAIAKVFREKKLMKLPGSPENVNDPKEFLRDLVWRHYRKPYLNTLHNEKIAKAMDVELLKRAVSFRPHYPFIKSVREALARR